MAQLFWRAVHDKKPTQLLQKIFDLRKAKKITLTQLGDAIGVKQTTIGNIENGNVPLKASDIPKIAKVLGVAPWQLFVEGEHDRLVPLSKKEEKIILALRKIESEGK